MKDGEYEILNYKIIIKNGRIAIFESNLDEFGNKYYRMVHKEYTYGMTKEQIEEVNYRKSNSPELLDYPSGRGFDVDTFIKNILKIHEQMKFDHKMKESVFGK